MTFFFILGEQLGDDVESTLGSFWITFGVTLGRNSNIRFRFFPFPHVVITASSSSSSGWAVGDLLPYRRSSSKAIDGVSSATVVAGVISSSASSVPPVRFDGDRLGVFAFSILQNILWSKKNVTLAIPSHNWTLPNALFRGRHSA